MSFSCGTVADDAARQSGFKRSDDVCVFYINNGTWLVTYISRSWVQLKTYFFCIWRNSGWWDRLATHRPIHHLLLHWPSYCLNIGHTQMNWLSFISSTRCRSAVAHKLSLRYDFLHSQFRCRLLIVFVSNLLAASGISSIDPYSTRVTASLGYISGIHWTVGRRNSPVDVSPSLKC